MGSCSFNIFLHNEKEEESKITEKTGNSHGNAFFNLSNSRTEEKEKEIKNNFNKKIPDLGKIIHIKDFEQLTGNIFSYISENKLDYKKYIPNDLVTYNSFPIQFKNNNIYYGNWNEFNEMEGYGIYYIYEQKIVTEGVWLKGNIIYGRIFFPNGNKYEGEIKNSVPHGKGQIKFDNGDIYNGDFDMGKMDGEGTFLFSDKSLYKGEIKNGLFNGKGTMKWSTGVEYNGYFVDSSLSGNGQIFNIQGEEYKGNFDKNEFNGEGTYSFNNGEQYKGNFEYGIKKGKGKYKRNEKIIFEGLWNQDYPNGIGFIYYEDNLYKGFWRNGNLFGEIQLEEGDKNTDINNIDFNIRPLKQNINPNSLPHLKTNDINISQFIQNTEFDFD